MLSENYKNRILSLAGILLEDGYANMSKRFKPTIQAIADSIKNGQQIGVIYQGTTNGQKIWSARLLNCVCIGTSVDGSTLIRAIHKDGASKRASGSGPVSTQAHNVWRLFSVNGIKSMWYTGVLFDKIELPGFNPQDSAMNRIIQSFSPATAKAYKDSLNKQSVNNIQPEVKPKIEPTRPANQIQPTPSSTAKPNTPQTKPTTKLPTGPKPLPKVPGNAPRSQNQAA